MGNNKVAGFSAMEDSPQSR